MPIVPILSVAIVVAVVPGVPIVPTVPILSVAIVLAVVPGVPIVPTVPILAPWPFWLVL